MDPPKNLTSLNARIRNVAGLQQNELRVRTAVSTTVLSQMMPESAVKGGTAMKLRLGHDEARFSADYDVAQDQELADFIAALQTALTKGWNGFSGMVKKSRSVSNPDGVRPDYIMQAYNVKLTFQGQSWCTVPLEVGRDEIGDVDDAEMQLAPDLIDLFRQIGLPDPAPVKVLAVHHQVSQKLHACTLPGSERAHDLVDLQLLDATGDLDLSRIRQTAVRLFTSRHEHEWPPVVVKGPDWDGLYAAQADGIDKVLPDVDDAIIWANELIGRINTAG